MVIGVPNCQLFVNVAVLIILAAVVCLKCKVLSMMRSEQILHPEVMWLFARMDVAFPTMCVVA